MTFHKGYSTIKRIKTGAITSKKSVRDRKMKFEVSWEIFWDFSIMRFLENLYEILSSHLRLGIDYEILRILELSIALLEQLS